MAESERMGDAPFSRLSDPVARRPEQRFPAPPVPTRSPTSTVIV